VLVEPVGCDLFFFFFFLFLFWVLLRYMNVEAAMESNELSDIRESRAEIMAAVLDMDMLLSEELLQIQARKRELDHQIETTQKRLQQQLTALRVQVKASVKASQRAEEKLQKQKKGKNDRRKASGPPHPPPSIIVSDPNLNPLPPSRRGAAQMFAERSLERLVQLQNNIAAREEFLTSRVLPYPECPIAAELSSDYYDSGALTLSPSGTLDREQRKRLAALLRIRASEFAPDLTA
jgi:multidrug efflux pump subunit AcrA (membrane-fusion protein)